MAAIVGQARRQIVASQSRYDPVHDGQNRWWPSFFPICSIRTLYRIDNILLGALLNHIKDDYWM